MVSDTVGEATVAIEAQAGDVMASVEDGETFIIADVTRDGAFCTMPLEAAASLPAWR